MPEYSINIARKELENMSSKEYGDRKYDLSVIIPARNEAYLENTIRNVLENIRGKTEVIAVLDGYLPNPELPLKQQMNINDDRVYFIHFKDSIGQRPAINYAAKISQSKYIMKLDAHCAVDEGFDVKLAADCEYDWTVVPRMYNLQIAEYTCKHCVKVHMSPKPEKCDCGKDDFDKKDVWKPKLHKRTDYMYITSPNAEKPFRAQYYEGKRKDDYQRQPRIKKEIDDTMCCMGPGWFLHRDRFWELEGCDEGHGDWGQQGIEVALKAWLSGGALKVNKKTWFAHWFRGSDGGFPYPASGNAHEKARQHSRDLWLNNKWPKCKRDLDWLVDKFNAPGWKKEKEYTRLQSKFYQHVHVANRNPKWRGIKTLKLPGDFLIYQQVIHKNKPDFIIEIGTALGGFTLFLADMCEINKHGHVISIDPSPRGELPTHPRITYLKGDSKSDEIIWQVKEIVGDKTAMLSIDGLHKRVQVKWELTKYKNIVTPGQYMVVEDCYGRQGELVGPGEARDWFLASTKAYKLDRLSDQFICGMTKDGWLRRVK